MCVCVCVWARACVRACVCVCVRARWTFEWRPCYQNPPLSPQVQVHTARKKQQCMAWNSRRVLEGDRSTLSRRTKNLASSLWTATGSSRGEGGFWVTINSLSHANGLTTSGFLDWHTHYFQGKGDDWNIWTSTGDSPVARDDNPENTRVRRGESAK